MILAPARFVRLSMAPLFSISTLLLLTASLPYAATPGLPFSNDAGASAFVQA
jgi:hypothetical protein